MSIVLACLSLCRFDQAMVAFIDCLQQVQARENCFVLRVILFIMLYKAQRHTLFLKK